MFIMALKLPRHTPGKFLMPDDVCFLDGHVETIPTPIPDRMFAE